MIIYAWRKERFRGGWGDFRRGKGNTKKSFKNEINSGGNYERKVTLAKDKENRRKRAFILNCFTSMNRRSLYWRQPEAVHSGRKEKKKDNQERWRSCWVFGLIYKVLHRGVVSPVPPWIRDKDKSVGN